MPLHDAVRQRLQPLTSAVTSNRIFLYSVFSTFAVAATIANACRAHSNFYSVSIYLSKSSRSVLVLANFGFLCALLSGRIFQRIFFGPLQPREVERLYDQTWMFVTESLLAFTIFRDEFDVPFLLMFGFLLFVKCFHWLMADRVESMDQTPYPGPPTLFHVRINALFGVLWAIDITMFAFAVESTLTNGVGGMVLFASEYAILLASALNAMMRYALSILDLRRARTRGGENAPPWENKSMYIFYIELLTDFLKLATYMTFFMIILTFYGLPLNIIRDVFVTARSFITRLRALVRYHNATRDMDRRYPDATEAELAEMSDRTCIICREEMHSRVAAAPGAQDPAPDQQQQQPPPADGPNMTPKKLPCGHIFHFQCLRSWLERQQSCPTCRRTVLDNNATQNAQQAPGQGPQGAARPRPGAAPLPGAAPGGAVAGNGPLGWVGRFLGLPQAPPAGQFPGAQGQVPPPGGFQPHAPLWNQPPPPGMAMMPPPPPHLFYDLQAWQQQNPGAPLPQHIPVQQPPVFNGFYGPGHVWQPWVDPRALGQQPPAQAQAQTETQVQPGEQQDVPPPQPRPSPRPPSVAAPTANGQAPEEATAAVSQGGQSDSQTSTPTPTTAARRFDPNERLDGPRRAAAIAALMRSDPNAPSATAWTEGRTVARDPPPAEAAASESTTTETSTPTPTVPSSEGSSSTSTAGSSAPGAPQPTPTTQAAGPSTLPALIPLYDTSIVQPTHVPGPHTYYAPYSHFYRTPSGRPPAQRVPASSSSSTSSQPQAQPGPGQTSQIPRSARAGPGGTRTPLAQLPPTLTDEQLARLDRLTREAIDERLRVLEGVSGAIYRCMEELTRVRSVLPVGATRRAGPAPAQRAPAAGYSAEADVAAASSTSGSSVSPQVVPCELPVASGSATPSEDESVPSEMGEIVDAAPEASPRDGAGATAN
ncbi:hypothetical protein C8Q77DRAFT_1057555 [Trametes polyzona]|nr:hypothetical protein C8Q77DRAFT_1057555 [Trametes polyzona]